MSDKQLPGHAVQHHMYLLHEHIYFIYIFTFVFITSHITHNYYGVRIAE